MNDERQPAMEGRGDRRNTIDLHIEELVLHGFDPGDRYRIGAAVEAELARLLSEQGVSPALARGGELATLDGGSFDVAPGASPEGVGGQVAQAVHGGLNQ